MKYRTILKFELPYDDLKDGKAELKEFIQDALECWGGQRHPDDWLFDSLQDVKVGAINKITRRSTKK